MTYLLRHGAKFEDVAISPQGYVAILDITYWLIGDLNVNVEVEDIKKVAATDLKGRFTVLGDSICAVIGHSIELPHLSIPEYDENRGCNKRYLVHDKKTTQNVFRPFLEWI